MGLHGFSNNASSSLCFNILYFVNMGTTNYFALISLKMVGCVSVL
uniref:Uncharacterized protein n=1 Tax=Anguilla anguilla TaxID=7936 RepID=A0A0E9VEL5_ANGAN